MFALIGKWNYPNTIKTKNSNPFYPYARVTLNQSAEKQLGGPQNRHLAGPNPRSFHQRTKCGKTCEPNRAKPAEHPRIRFEGKFPSRRKTFFLGEKTFF